jgi:lipoate-protein ligase A
MALGSHGDLTSASGRVSAVAEESWRYLDLGRTGPYENAAVMPVLVRSVAETSRPVAQISVWGQTHINVGWFDDVDATLDLDRCQEIGIDVIRRMFAGGGTVWYQAECSMMWGLLLPKVDFPDLDDALRRFQSVVIDALERVGLGAVQFEGSSDLRWKGRKLGGLAAQDVVACQSVGGFLNLQRPDLDDFLSVFRVPDDKFKDKVVKDMREYICTAEEVAGRPVTFEEVRDALVAALAADGIELEASELTAGEQKGFTKTSARVGSDEQLRRISSERFRADAPPGSFVGFGNEKGRKLCRAGVAIDSAGLVVEAMFAGDMQLAPPDALERTAAALVGARAADAADVRARVASVFEGDDIAQADELMGVTTDDLTEAVRKAVADSGAPST